MSRRSNSDLESLTTNFNNFGLSSFQWPSSTSSSSSSSLLARKNRVSSFEEFPPLDLTHVQPFPREVSLDEIYFSGILFEHAALYEIVNDKLATGKTIGQMIESLPPLRVAMINKRYHALDNKCLFIIKLLRLHQNKSGSLFKVKVLDYSHCDQAKKYYFNFKHPTTQLAEIQTLDHVEGLKQTAKKTAQTQTFLPDSLIEILQLIWSNYLKGLFVADEKVEQLLQVHYLPSSLSDYYDKDFKSYNKLFIFLICEEIRSIMKQELIKVSIPRRNNPEMLDVKMAFKMKCKSFKPQSKFQILNGVLDVSFMCENRSLVNDAYLKPHHFRTKDIVLLIPGEIGVVPMGFDLNGTLILPEVYFLASVSFTPEHIKCVSFKISCPSNERQIIFQKFQEGKSFSVLPLGSLLSIFRQFDNLKHYPSVSDDDFYCKYDLMNGPSIACQHDINYEDENKSNSHVMQELSKRLNHSQVNAILNCAHPTQDGIGIIVGPPGTGKTETLSYLLSLISCQSKRKRILVCAPSNRALKVLLFRFHSVMTKLNLKIPYILAGVSDKLFEENENKEAEDALNEDESKAILDGHVIFENCFLHSWLSVRLNRFTDLLSNGAIGSNLPNVIESIENLFDEVKLFRLNEFFSSFESKIVLFQSFKHNKMQDINSLVKLVKYILETLQSIIFFSKPTTSGENFFETKLLTNSQIVFSTLCVAGRKQMISAQNKCAFDITVIDEASQTTESESLIAITCINPRNIILAGDPNQLPATCISPFASKSQSDRSLLWRFIKDQNLPDTHYNLLSIQYRMDPKICEFPSKHFYQSRLKNDISVTPERRLQWVPLCFQNVPNSYFEPLVVVDVEDGVEENKGTSKCNPTEAKQIVIWLEALTDRFPFIDEKNVLIITFYSAQVNCIRAELQKTKKWEKFVNRVQTVDSSQGSEVDIVIISCVRSNNNNSVGFLSDFRRLNVALTRARRILAVFANTSTLSNSSNADLKSFMNFSQDKNLIYPSLSLEQLSSQSKKTQTILPPQTCIDPSIYLKKQ